MSPNYPYIRYIVLVFASLTVADLFGPSIALSRKVLPLNVKFQA